MKEAEVLIKLGNKIKKLRLKKNISQHALALECNFEKASMSRIESGKSNITILTLQKISNALETPIHEFLKD